ncbi:MAG: hypothetical protein OHK93_003688 [Ramalina farinacea]|uniref:Amino acid transporter n=1 Tax=Ramalina farinacea TaxID=258253 RepID=A0AA43QVJ0_9LECA|nr:hypothetical protein [Ramalina farinacea]
MPPAAYTNLAPPPRDSLELASLASSDPEAAPSSRSSSPSGISSSRRLSLSNDDPLHPSPSNAPSRPNPHARSYSVSSAFDFASNLFPLSSTAAAGYTVLGASTATNPTDLGGAGASLEKHKSLTYLNGLSLIVGLIIGSGIFSSPAQVSINAGSYGGSLIVWTVAGILAWTGAASYAELGGAIPLNGGSQIYLSKIYGDMVGFLFTWCAVFVLRPGSAAIISIIFGEYMVRAAAGADAENVTGWVNKGVAILGLAGVTALNCVSTKLGTRMGDVFMFFKFVALFGITITGIVVALTGFTFNGTPNVEWKTTGWFEGTSTDPSSWAVALYAGLWAYDGWDNSNYVVGEFLDPGRDLSRVIHTAMPMVMFFYLAASVAYIFVLPEEVIISSNTVAVKFGSVVFGPIGSLVLALVVGGSCIGALNAQTFTSGRLVYAAGKEGFLPSILGHIGMPGSSNNNEPINRFQRKSWLSRTVSRIIGDQNAGIGFTPINAMLANAIITVGYIVIGEFATLITFSGVVAYGFYFITVLGLIILRVREPYLERPYKTWITTPIIFCCVSLFLLSRSLVAKPAQVVIVIAFVVAGIPVYFWRVRGRGRKGKGEEGDGWKFWKRWGRS